MKHPQYLSEVIFVIPTPNVYSAGFALHQIPGVREVQVYSVNTVKVWYRITPDSPGLQEVEDRLCRLLEG